MFRIGEFSRLGRVTIETLRHYDALGLLNPAKVDRTTGYRYYSARQLPKLNRIMALKEVGFSLEEIARILRDNLRADEMRGMLKAQLVLAESDIETAQLRRESILGHLRSLDLEDNFSTYDVTLKPIEAYTIAAIRETIPTVEQVPGRLGEMFNTIAGWIHNHKLPIGPPLTIYHDESYSPEDIDTECAFIIPGREVDSIEKPDTPIAIRLMEAVQQAATTVVADDFHQKVEGLKPAYSALVQWIEDHGYSIASAPRELYYGTPESQDFTAEIQFPVGKCHLDGVEK